MRKIATGLAAAGLLMAAAGPARSVPAEQFFVMSFGLGLVNSQAIAADDATSVDEAQRALAWLEAVEGRVEEVRDRLFQDLEEERSVIVFGPESEAARDREIGRLRNAIDGVKPFGKKLAKWTFFVRATRDADTERDLVKLLAKSAKKGVFPAFLHYIETASAVQELIDGLDAAALEFADRIERDEERLLAVEGAAETKQGRRALKLIQLYDRLSEGGADERLQLQAQLAHTFASPLETLPKSGKANKQDKAVVKRIKQALTRYGKYAFSLESIARQLEKRVTAALAAVTDPGDPVDPPADCTPTFADSPDTGGGLIEVIVGGGGTRRYPASTVATERSGQGNNFIGGASELAGFPDDFVFLGLRDTVLNGPGTYDVQVDGELGSAGRPVVVYDQRGPDGDPFTENNFSFRDWERDVLSGTLTLHEVDFSKTGRRIRGTFVLETAFLDNPEGLRGEATITIHFDVCGFVVSLLDGSFDYPE